MEELTRFINDGDEVFLIEMLDFARRYHAEDDGTILPHETPEFFADMERIDADIESGKERTYSHEEAMDFIRNGKPLP